jgi:uncharacterized protein
MRANERDKFSRLAALRPAPGTAGLARPPALGVVDEEDGLAQLIGAKIGRNRYGEHLTARNWFETPEFAEPSNTALELLSRNREENVSQQARAAVENPQKWLFLDTETTGLAGGTGTYAFLVGIAWWDAGGMQVEQFFMRDFEEEFSLLYELAARIAERPVLVTFNGKSFDWPLLESRFTMTRAIGVPELAAHLDLLHPARAIWRWRLGSVRLMELEKHVLDAAELGWRRENDVESALIPQFYFDYLRGGPVAPLVGVVRHNQMDLRGLGALFGKLNEMLKPEPHEERAAESLDLFGLSRYLQRRGERNRAERECLKAIERGLPDAHQARAKRELAQLSKRRGDLQRAKECWRELLGDAENYIHACEQLAIYYERHAHDLEMAVAVCEQALHELEKRKKRVREPVEAARDARSGELMLRRLARLRKRNSVRTRWRVEQSRTITTTHPS